jgi:hypothetical protein
MDPVKKRINSKSIQARDLDQQGLWLRLTSPLNNISCSLVRIFSMPPPVCRPCDRSGDALPPQNIDISCMMYHVCNGVENSTEPAAPDCGRIRAYRYKTGPLFVGF